MLKDKVDYRLTLILIASNYYNWLQAFYPYFTSLEHNS